MITLHWSILIGVFLLGSYFGGFALARRLDKERLDEVAKSRDLGHAEGLGEGFERGVEYSRAAHEGRRQEALNELVGLSQMLLDASREARR